MKKSIDVSGLTVSQVALIEQIIAAFKEKKQEK